MTYDRDELRQAAQIVLQDKKQAGDRSFNLIMQMCIITGLGAKDVLARIKELAT